MSRALLLPVSLSFAAGPVQAFTIDDDFHRFVGGVLDVASVLVEAPRWDAADELADGIQVSVDQGRHHPHRRGSLQYGRRRPGQRRHHRGGRSRAALRAAPDARDRPPRRPRALERAPRGVMDTDGRPTTIIAADLGPPRAEISAGSPIGESIMNTGTGGVLFTNQPFLHPDDVSGLKVL